MSDTSYEVATGSDAARENLRFLWLRHPGNK